MATPTDTKQKVEWLERELNQAQDAIRRLSEQQRDTLLQLATTKEEIHRMQVGLAQLQGKNAQAYQNSVNRYE